MRYLAAALLGAYQATLSPLAAVLFGARCRYYPTCSQYAKEAVLKYGVLRGAAMAAGRLVRCAPWSPGGVDLVP